jgi:predicted ATPase
MILNEPETSLHADLLAPLARLMIKAAKRSQIIVVTHADALASELNCEAECRHFALEKQLGETHIGDCDKPAWTWPTR